MTSVNTGCFIAVNGSKEAPVNKVSRFFALNYWRPRNALYDTDYSTASFDTPVGPVPGTWKLGPGLPGLAPAGGYSVNSDTILVTRDIMTRTWWGNTRSRPAVGATTATLNPYDHSTGTLYDGTTNTPQIDLECEIPKWTDSGGDPVRLHNIPAGMKTLYFLGEPDDHNRLKMLRPFWDDPIDVVKIQDWSAAIYPEGWTYDGLAVASPRADYILRTS
jgi:hypothetical protein